MNVWCLASTVTISAATVNILGVVISGAAPRYLRYVSNFLPTLKDIKLTQTRRYFPIRTQ